MLKNVCQAELKPPLRLPVLMMLGLCGLASATTAAEDWPQHRGPNRDGRAPAAQILESWPESGPLALWRQPLGAGFSGLAIVGERIFTLFSDDHGEYLGSFTTTNGRELWRQRLGDRFEDTWGDGPRSTPTVHGEKVYGLSSYGRLVAARAEDGEILWTVDFDTLGDNIKAPDFGYSPSPLIVEDRLITEIGGHDGGLIGAFRLRDGQRLWATESGRAGYSSPIALRIGDQTQIIFLTRNAVVALGVDGDTLWRWPFSGGSPYDLPIATPVSVAEDRVFISHRAEGGSALLQIPSGPAAAQPEALWESPYMLAHLNSGVAHKDLLFGFHNATLKALSTHDAKLHWGRRGLGKGSLIQVGGSLLVLSDSGELVLLDATAEAYRERGRLKVFDDLTWTAPSFARGTLYLRSVREMVALDLTQAQPAPQPPTTPEANP